MKRFTIKTLKFCAFLGIFVALFWYATNAVGNLDNFDRLIIGLTIFGVTYGISRPLFEGISEVVGGIMVIAEFLNRHLLEPQKQRLLDEGRKEGHKEGLEEGRAQERAEIRARLKARGLNPDEILPDNAPEKIDDEG